MGTTNSLHQDKDLPIPNRVAVVTGGGTGIGFGCAQYLAREGSAVVLFGPEIDVLKRAVLSLRDQGCTAHGVAGDVSASSSVRALMEEVQHRFGRLDIVVNSAAIQPYGTVETMPEEEWDRVLSVNLKGIYLMCHYGIPLIKKGGGAEQS